MTSSVNVRPFWIACVGTTVMGLWVQDTLVGTALISRMIMPDDFVGGLGDYIALLLMETQVAVVLTIGAVAGATLLNLLPWRRDFMQEFVALLLSGFCGLVVFGRVYSTRVASNNYGVIIGVIIALLTWLGFRIFLRRRSENSWPIKDLMHLQTYAGLVVGYAGNVVIGAAQGKDSDFVDAASLVIFAALGIGYYLCRSLALRRLIHWFPVILSVCLIILFTVDSRRYGSNEDYLAQSTDSERIPIVLIVLDTVRADHLKRFGYSRNTMPGLENWADKAVTLTRAVSPAGWTSPAHASMFSGRTVSLHGIHYSATHGTFNSQAVDGIEWLPHLLADQGYFCLAISANRFALPQEAIGFHRTLTPTHNRFELTLASLWDRKSPILQRFSERLRWRIPYTDVEAIVDVAMRATPPGNQPLFLFINILDAHSPYNPPVTAIEELGIRTDNVFPRYRKHRWLTQNWRSFRDEKAQFLNDLYDGELRWIDTHLARLLGWLEDRFSGNAVIIVVSDHGEELGENDRIGHEFGLSQSLIHVPFFVRAPWLQVGQIDKIVDLRRLFDFIHRCGTGMTPDATVLTEADEFGVISERYASWSNANSLGPSYGRSWVTIFEAGRKGIGPSEHQIDVFEMGKAAFVNESQITDPTVIEYFRNRIDAYWENHRDVRESSVRQSESDEERLRALGYVQ